MEILQVAQHADDLDRASAFYEMLLGGPPAACNTTAGVLYFNVGRSRLLLDAAAPSCTFSFLVDDVRQSIERMHTLGVEVVDEPHVVFTHTDDTLGPAGNDEWLALIRDSEGNTVGLISHEPRHDP